MSDRLSSDALAVLSAFLGATDVVLPAGAKVALARGADELMAEGWDMEEITRAVERFARTHLPGERFAEWAQAHRPRAWWITDP